MCEIQTWIRFYIMFLPLLIIYLRSCYTTTNNWIWISFFSQVNVNRVISISYCKLSNNRLKPWVHYVPISYNGADVIKKIEWLNSHPELAYKIALNAKTFGESFLRLEDYFCYMATLLYKLGEYYHNVSKHNEDILIPFNAKPVFNTKHPK